MPADQFFYIPHIHWEGAVFKTREEYLEMGLPNILRVLRLLKGFPSYRFLFDQVCYVRPFLERYPEQAETFRKFVAEGRLAIVGGMDVMPDVNMPGGESLIRQILYGKGYFRRELGVDVKIGWLLDTFGHHAQMPQLLKLAGYQSHWFFRGVPNWETPSEFLWEGLDGSQIAAYWLPFGYAHTFFSPKTLPEFTQFFKQKYAELVPFTQTHTRVGLAGADVCEPEEHVPALVEQFNQQPNPFNIRIGLPDDYERAVEQEKPAKDRPVIRGELNPIFQGIYSSRIELKQRTRELERLLTTAEKLGVLLNVTQPANQKGSSQERLWQAWEPMLFNQTHDLMSGVMTDHVYEDTLRGYDFSARIAEEEVVSRLQELVGQIDTRAKHPGERSIPLVVFNGLGWQRTDAVTVQVGFSDEDVTGLQLVDAEWRPQPVQVLEADRYSNGSLLRARIVFLARDVPALGYAVYILVPLKNGEILAPSGDVQPEGVCLENESFRLELDPASGAITSLVSSAGNWPVLAGPGNVIAMEEDRGDLWEPYHALDGGSRIAMKDRHPAPQPGKAVFSNEVLPDPTVVATRLVRGPVCSEYAIERPFSQQGRFQTTIRICAGLGRIEIHTRILNNDRFVRYRALFPSTLQGGQIVHEIPFGAEASPDGIEFPAQNWIDLSDGGKGLALLNRGLPGNNVADGILMVSLLRCTCIVAYGFFGGYEPGMSSESGFELGQERTFDYALLPHQGKWQEAEVYRAGLEFNQPLLGCTASPHPGSRPARWGFLEISHANIVLSALKPGEQGGAILRLYEASGVPAAGVELHFNMPVQSAELVNLMEDSLEPLPMEGNSLRLDFRPFEIKTVKVHRTRMDAESAE